MLLQNQLMHCVSLFGWLKPTSVAKCLDPSLFFVCLFFVCLFIFLFQLCCEFPLPIVFLIGCLFLPVRWSPTSAAKCLVPSLCWSAPSPSWSRWFTLWNQCKKLNWGIKKVKTDNSSSQFCPLKKVFVHPSWSILYSLCFHNVGLLDFKMAL